MECIKIKPVKESVNHVVLVSLLTDKAETLPARSAHPVGIKIQKTLLEMLVPCAHAIRLLWTMQVSINIQNMITLMIVYHVQKDLSQSQVLSSVTAVLVGKL